MTDDEGRVIEGGGKGYRYFGRAKELPGVKELFEAATRPKASEVEKKVDTRGDLSKRVDAGYYGYGLDEEDGTLVAYERKKEKEAFEISPGMVKSTVLFARHKGTTPAAVAWPGA